jgi:hypothetical protein
VGRFELPASTSRTSLERPWGSVTSGLIRAFAGRVSMASMTLRAVWHQLGTMNCGGGCRLGLGGHEQFEVAGAHTRLVESDGRFKRLGRAERLGLRSLEHKAAHRERHDGSRRLRRRCKSCGDGEFSSDEDGFFTGRSSGIEPDWRLTGFAARRL